MAIEVDTVTGAACWASYLINGDASGLTDQEIKECDAWAEQFAPAYVVSVAEDEDGNFQEPWFTWSYGVHTGAKTRGGDCLDYVTHKVTP